MDEAQVFQFSSTVAMLMWLLMIVLPQWKGTQFLVKFRLVPLLLSLLYIIYISISMAGAGFPDFGSLESVMSLFTKQDAVLAGWIHYLAFDLLVGMWILKEARTREMHHLIIVPCLLCTFMFGPLGFVLFSILKTFKKTSK